MRGDEKRESRRCSSKRCWLWASTTVSVSLSTRSSASRRGEEAEERRREERESSKKKAGARFFIGMPLFFFREQEGSREEKKRVAKNSRGEKERAKEKLSHFFFRTLFRERESSKEAGAFQGNREGFPPLLPDESAMDLEASSLLTRRVSGLGGGGGAAAGGDRRSAMLSRGGEHESEWGRRDFNHESIFSHCCAPFLVHSTTPARRAHRQDHARIKFRAPDMLTTLSKTLQKTKTKKQGHHRRVVGASSPLSAVTAPEAPPLLLLRPYRRPGGRPLRSSIASSGQVSEKSSPGTRETERFSLFQFRRKPIFFVFFSFPRRPLFRPRLPSTPLPTPPLFFIQASSASRSCSSRAGSSWERCCCAPRRWLPGPACGCSCCWRRGPSGEERRRRRR